MQAEPSAGSDCFSAHALQDLSLMFLPRSIRDLPAKKIPHLIFLAGLLTGISFFIYYHAHDLTLAHYDAKAHLLVARRIVDSLEPGYAQMGVNWLPLVHLVYLPFVIFRITIQVGISAEPDFRIRICIVGMADLPDYLSHHGSVAASVFAAVILLGNPNLEYLQSCPLTEPLYMVLLLLALDSLISWRESDHSRQPWLAAVWVSLGALCRYEGWYVLAGVLLLLLYDFGTQYMPRRKALQAAGVFLGFFSLPALMHFGYIFFRLGDSFFHRVAEGNPSPYLTFKRPIVSVIYHLGELSQMAEVLPLLLAIGGLLLFFFERKKFAFRIPLMLLWLPSLINISALYWGMIYRLRYSVLLLPAVAIFGGLAISSATARKRAFILLLVVVMALPWLSWCFSRIDPDGKLLAGPGALWLPAVGLFLFMFACVRQLHGWALLGLCVLGMQVPLLAREDHSMMVETMEHGFIEPERHEIMQYIRQNYDGKRILIDMGKQAPLVYDSGLNVREFIYNEGGKMLWNKALHDPGQQAGWLCVQMGDELWTRLQIDPGWAADYSVALKNKYYSLYRIKK